MKIKLEKFNICSFLFYFSYFLLLVCSFAHRVVYIAPYVSKIKFISMIIFLFVCFIQSKEYNRKKFLLILVSILLCFINFYISDESTLLILFLVVFSSKNVDLEDFIKKDIYFKLFITLFVISMYYLGLTNYYDCYRDGVLRYSLGFNHPNALGSIISSIVIEYLFLKKNKIKIIELVIVFLICLFIQRVTDSRTSILLILIMLFYVIFSKKINTFMNYKVFQKVICWSWFIFSFMSFFSAYLYSLHTDIGLYLDDLFSTRLQWIVYFFEKYSINLFGNQLHLVSSEVAKLTGENSAILDNAYSRFLLQHGIVLFVYFGILMRNTLKWAYSKLKFSLIFVLMVFIIKGLSEHSIYIISSNVFLIYFSRLFFEKKVGDLK